MLLGVIADDFTGASDIANTLAKGLPEEGGGLATYQYLGVPAAPAARDVEAGVVALKSRSTPVENAVAQSLAALEWLRAQGCRQIVFKYCSTFDSTPDGNIGPVAEALAAALDARGVVVCPAFPTLGRTVHQGHLFVQDRLLSESGMRDHPLTPMTDPDLRRWLARQTTTPVGLVPAGTVRAGAEAIRAALSAAGARGETLAIVDAATDADLLAIGEACRAAPLLTGGSGIALGLPRNFLDARSTRRAREMFAGVAGPITALAGSCSTATREQIKVHAADNPVLPLAIDDIMAGAVGAADVVGFALKHAGAVPLVYSSDAPREVAAAQARYGREVVAARLEDLFANTARSLVARGVTRLVVAGGETSGAVAQALDLGALKIGPEIDPGVPVLVSGQRGVALALKSGNFGRPTFFADAARALGVGIMQ